MIKVVDIAWLEFEKPDLTRAEAFARAFGFQTARRGPDELQLRGTDAGAPCVIVRRGQRTRFAGVGVSGRRRGRRAAAGRQIRRCRAAAAGGDRRPSRSTWSIPAGSRCTWSPECTSCRSCRAKQPHSFNFGHDLRRTNTAQRPRRVPARVQRLGHLVVQSTKYREALNWYLDNLGMIVSDFLFFPGQRERGPTMSFIRCDRGSTPADHHTLAIALGPANRYVHSAYQVSDLDALAAGGEYLRDRGYFRSWGIGRHIQGSQIFDYWRDPDGFLVEHFADGDMFDNTLEPGWAPFTASGLAQWGPPATRDFLGTDPKSARHELVSMITALRENNEFDIRRLIGLLKVPTS